MKDTFASKTFHSKTFASGDWQGIGAAITILPNALLGHVYFQCDSAGSVEFITSNMGRIAFIPEQLAGIEIEP